MNRVINEFGQYSASKLSDWSHIDGSPWDYVYNKMDQKYDCISFNIIKNYFENIQNSINIK
jgi:uncharacterized phage-associated protein